LGRAPRRRNLELVVKEEMVVVAKGNLLQSRLPRRSEKFIFFQQQLLFLIWFWPTIW
jgi:hypothetical protein